MSEPEGGKKGGIIGKVRALLDEDRKKSEAVIRTFLEEGEEMEDWFSCETHPPFWVTIIPYLDKITRLSHHYYTLVMTNRRLMRIESSAIAGIVPRGVDSFDFSKIVDVVARHSFLSDSVLVATDDGKKTVYREVTEKGARGLQAWFEARSGIHRGTPS